MTKKKFINNLLTLFLITSFSMLLGGCLSTSAPENLSENSDDPYRSYIYSDTIKKRKPTIDIEEYVSRVGKKVILVSDYPEAEHSFKVQNTSSQPFTISENGNITISKDALLTLQDEAELAVVLAHAINRINTNFQKLSSSEEDNDVASVISRAGYDPSAIVDIQERYLNNPSSNEWLSTITYNEINQQRVANSKQIVSKSPKGLCRNKNNYINIVIDS